MSYINPYLLGTLGGICFAYCGVPLAWATVLLYHYYPRRNA